MCISILSEKKCLILNSIYRRLWEYVSSPHVRVFTPYTPNSSGKFSVFVRAQLHSFVRLFVTPWTVAYQAPLSMGFSQKEYGVSCHFYLQGICPAQGSNPHLLCLLHGQADS